MQELPKKPSDAFVRIAAKSETVDCCACRHDEMVGRVVTSGIRLRLNNLPVMPVHSASYRTLQSSSQQMAVWQTSVHPHTIQVAKLLQQVNNYYH